MWVLVGLAMVCSAASSVCAQTSDEMDVIAAEIPKEETGQEADHATGDWGGLRNRLVDRGVHLYAGYMGEVLGNVSGGLRRGAIYEGLLELGIDLNTERLQLWKNGLFRANAIYPHGASVSRKYSGDILTASNIDAPDSFRLYELWYQHSFSEQGLSFRLGQLVADEEFAFTESGGAFLNSAFGWPAFVSANVVNTGPAFFMASPGLRVRYEPTTAWYVQAGVYDGDTFDSATGDPNVNSHGTRIHLDEEQGMLAMTEAGFLLNHGEQARGLPGVYKIGAWIHTGEFSSNFEMDRTHSKSFGFYGVAEQMIWREREEQGLRAFGRAGVAPRDRSFFELVADCGLTSTGLLPGRDEDIAGVGFVYARISRDIQSFERYDSAINGVSYAGYSNHESVLEAFYTVQLTKWWTVQPDFQWIFNPGGTSADSDALVLGLRTSVVF